MLDLSDVPLMIETRLGDLVLKTWSYQWVLDKLPTFNRIFLITRAVTIIFNFKVFTL
jgi:hypothetical protein